MIAACLAAAAFLLPAAHAALRLDSAVACIQPDGAPPCAAAPVALPFHWDREHAAVHGSARFTLSFDAAQAGADETPGLLLPRVGNAFAVALNGNPVYHIGHSGTRSHDSVKRPWLIALPPGLLRAEGNRLEITIEATAGRAAQLSPVTLGRMADLEADFERELFWRQELTASMMWAAFVLGFMALAAWWVQREPMFMCYAIAELAWGARLADMFFVAMPLPWQAWGASVAATFGISQLAMTQFFLHAVGRWQGPWRRAYWTYAAVWMAIVPVVVLVEWRELWIGWVATGTLGFVLLALYVGWRGFRERHHWRWIFASLVLLATISGAADMAESPGSMYMHPTWSRFVWLGYSLALAALVARRLLRARLAQERAHDQLREALAAQAKELEEANRSRARGELELAMEQERQRVMRDMHDVLGGRLSTLLSLAGRQGSAAAELQSEVRTAITELREVVTAMTPFDGNLATMLGSLRPQLERRLALVGVTLDWSVDDLPVGGSFTPTKVQHLRHLLLEAATNVARHAQARRAALSARVEGGTIEIKLADDGVGFEPAAASARGNGLRNMHWRAQALGAELLFDGRAGGATLTLRLPP